MKRFLCVNPWVHDFAAFDFWLKPLGLLRIASVLRKAGGDVLLLDLLDRNHPWLSEGVKTDSLGRGKFFAEEIPKPDLLKPIPRTFKRHGIPKGIVEKRISELPDVDAVLFTSGMTYWYKGLEETVRIVRSRYPDVPFILGGIYATLMPEHARKHSGADESLPGAYENLKSRLEKILSLELPHKVPFAAWDLYPKLDYAVMTISNGCPMRCTYCASRLVQPEFIPEDTDRVLDELEDFLKIGVRRIAFYDDALLFHPNLDEILEEIIRMRAGFEFHTPNGLHVTAITPRRAKLMKDAGFRTIYLSLETVDKRLLEETGNKVSQEAFAQAATILKNAGFEREQLHAYALFGLPGQTEESVKQTLEAALSSGVTPHIAEFSPVPGTLDFQRCGLTQASDPLFTNNTFRANQETLKDSWKRLKEYLKARLEDST